MRKKLLLIFSFALLSSFALFAAKKGKISVAVTFDAMKELTQAVTGDKADIYVIIPPGIEPHDFEPKAKDLAFLKKAKVLVYNGLGMEFWLDSALSAVKNKKLIKVEASQGVAPIGLDAEEHDDCCCCCKHGDIDPHSWLSLVSAKTMVANIEAAVVKADPANAGTYTENAKAYTEKLNALLEDYQNKFAQIKMKNFVTAHAAFAYLCRDFGLSQSSITGVFAECEPNAKQLAELVEYCKKHNVKVIFSEELANPELSNTLAKEVGAKVEKIYTIESPEDGLSYLERMARNLETIYTSLK